MKKLLALLLSVLMVMSLLAACGDKEEEEKKPEGSAAYLEALDLLEELEGQMDDILEAAEAEDQDAAMDAYQEMTETLSRFEELLDEMTEEEAEEINAKGEALTEEFQEKAGDLDIG